MTFTCHGRKPTQFYQITMKQVLNMYLVGWIVSGEESRVLLEYDAVRQHLFPKRKI